MLRVHQTTGDMLTRTIVDHKREKQREVSAAVFAVQDQQMTSVHRGLEKTEGEC